MDMVCWLLAPGLFRRYVVVWAHFRSSDGLLFFNRPLISAAAPFETGYAVRVERARGQR